MVVGSLDGEQRAGSIPFTIPVNMQDAEQGEEPLRIMLIGKSGAGKSSSGNTILGRQVFNSDMRLVRVTRFCEKETGTVKDVPIDVTSKGKDVPVAVIDTPGFFQMAHKKEDAVREIMQSDHLWESGPHAFVLVVPIARMTQEDQDTNALIEATFGPRVWDHTIVLFTHGDCLDEKTINDVITESDSNLRNFIRKCSGGFHVFNNREPQNEAQVTSFIAKIQTLVALNGGHPYNKAMFPDKERQIREIQEEILAEKKKDFDAKEKKLRDLYQGAELKEKKIELKRREESEARLAAEEQFGKKVNTWSILGCILIPSVIGLVGWERLGWWVVPVAVALMLLWIFFKVLPSISGKKRLLTKKNK